MMDRDTITRTGARAPGVKRLGRLNGGASAHRVPPTQNGDTTLQAARCTKGGCKLHDAKNSCSTGRPVRYTDLEAVLRENPPYGILGGAVETSASFEARSAPPPYPAIRGW